MPIYVVGFAVVTVLLEVFVRYSRYVSVLRWLTLSLFAYVATVFVVGVPWLTVARNLASRQRVMGEFTLTPWLKTLGWLATAAMAAAAIGMFATWSS
jgi:hypothetical protein